MKGGSKHINKEAAEISELYWAHQRKNRAIMNISRESAGNPPQYNFRRDYRLGEAYYFNVDGDLDISIPDGSELTQAERMELLTNRYFLTTTKYHGLELFPYRDQCIVKQR